MRLFKHVAVVVVLLSVAATVVAGSASCTFAHEDEMRYNWNLVQDYLQRSAASSEPEALYATAEMINPLLEGVTALYCSKKNQNASRAKWCNTYLDEIAGVLNGRNGTVTTSQIFVDMSGSWRKQVYTPPVSLWMENSSALEHPLEIILDSSQFTYTNARLLHAIAKYVPPQNRTTNMWEFIQSMSSLVARDQVMRWVFGPGLFQVHGWGCSGSDNPNNHSQFIRNKFTKAFGRTRGPAWCNAVQDMDMWIITTTMHLLAAYQADAFVVDFSPQEAADLLDYVRMGVKLVESRIQTNYNVENGFVFDLGVWDAASDYTYATYKGNTFPTTVPEPPVNITWDLSHGQRFVNVLMTIDELGDIGLPSRTNWTSYLAQQFTKVVYNGNCTQPLFSNYFNMDGWYRVGYSGKGWGYGLGDDGCGAAMHGGYGLLAAHAAKMGNMNLADSLITAIGCIDALIPTAPSQPVNSWLQERYFTMWQKYKRHDSKWVVGTLDTAVVLNMFYPAVVRCNS